MRHDVAQVVETGAHEPFAIGEVAHLRLERDVGHHQLIRVIGEKGEGLDRPLGGFERDEPGQISRHDHLAQTQMARLHLHLFGGDAEGQPGAARPFVQRGHETGRRRRSAAAIGIDEDETPFMAWRMGAAQLGEIQRRVPHERAVGEDPEVPLMPGQGRHAQGLPRGVVVDAIPGLDPARFHHRLDRCGGRGAEKPLGVERLDPRAQLGVMAERVHRLLLRPGASAE